MLAPFFWRAKWSPTTAYACEFYHITPENDLLHILGKLVYGILLPLHLQQQSKKNNEFV